MVLAGWDRVATFTAVNQTVTRNTLVYENIICYTVRDFSGTLLACASSCLPIGLLNMIWALDCFTDCFPEAVCIWLSCSGCGRALGSCRLLCGVWHRDIPKPRFVSTAVTPSPSCSLCLPSVWAIVGKHHVCGKSLFSPEKRAAYVSDTVLAPECMACCSQVMH